MLQCRLMSRLDPRQPCRFSWGGLIALEVAAQRPAIDRLGRDRHPHLARWAEPSLQSHGVAKTRRRQSKRWVGSHASRQALERDALVSTTFDEFGLRRKLDPPLFNGMFSVQRITGNLEREQTPHTTHPRATKPGTLTGGGRNDEDESAVYPLWKSPDSMIPWSSLTVWQSHGRVFALIHHGRVAAKRAIVSRSGVWARSALWLKKRLRW